MALGECGITYHDYRRMNIRTLLNTMIGRVKAKEQQVQYGYDQARLIASFWSKDAQKIKFPWEKKKLEITETRESLEAFIKTIEQRRANAKNLNTR